MCSFCCIYIWQIFATLNQKLDLETISSASNPFSLYVYLNRSQPVTTSLENHSEYFYILPIHLRYHDPKIGGGYREIKKSMAMLFSRCPDGIVTSSSAVVKFPCKPYSTDICEWSSLPFTQVSAHLNNNVFSINITKLVSLIICIFQKSLLPSLLIPVGNINFYEIVFLSTHITAYCGLIFILYHLFLIKIIS